MVVNVNKNSGLAGVEADTRVYLPLVLIFLLLPKNSTDHMKMWLPLVLYYTYLCGVENIGSANAL